MRDLVVENKKCTQCEVSFSITDTDREFYEKVSPIFNGEKSTIPNPKLCPECRIQRRLSFFNYKSLYKNTCSHCSKQIIARFPVGSKYRVLCIECWSRDKEEKLPKGEEIDYSKSIFDQIELLVRESYYQSLIGALSNVTNNAHYTNHTSEIKDSYLVFEANTVESSYYCFGIKNSIFAVDTSFSGNNECVYECMDCYEMHQCFYCQKSFGSQFSYFLDNCKNCSYCIGCSNLENKKYHIFNKEVSTGEYDSLKKNLESHSFRSEFSKKFCDFYKTTPKKYANIIGSENASGNNIIHSKDCEQSFDILSSENCKYSQQINYSQDIFDVSAYGEKSYCMYESVSAGRYSNNILFSSIIGKGDHLIYCIEVKKSKYCFGCVNLKGKEYCIFNKQYTKQEYDIIVPRLIKKMIQDKEWGEFFPGFISPFGYNETLAQEYFLLAREEVIKKGFNWSDYEAPKLQVEKIIPASKLPDTIEDIPDDILNWAIECEDTKQPFRVIKQELDFYRRYNIPIPRKHPDQRHLERMKLRNPRKLFARQCDKCQKEIETTYGPERKEKVYCQTCYNAELY